MCLMRGRCWSKWSSKALGICMSRRCIRACMRSGIWLGALCARSCTRFCACCFCMLFAFCISSRVARASIAFVTCCFGTCRKRANWRRSLSGGTSLTGWGRLSMSLQDSRSKRWKSRAPFRCSRVARAGQCSWAEIGSCAHAGDLHGRQRSRRRTKTRNHAKNRADRIRTVQDVESQTKPTLPRMHRQTSTQPTRNARRTHFTSNVDRQTHTCQKIKRRLHQGFQKQTPWSAARNGK